MRQARVHARSGGAFSHDFQSIGVELHEPERESGEHTTEQKKPDNHAPLSIRVRWKGEKKVREATRCQRNGRAIAPIQAQAVEFKRHDGLDMN